MMNQRSDIRQVRSNSKQRKPRIPSSKELLDQGKCIRCGTAGHSAPDCHHKSSLCHGCQQQGHLKRVCQTLRKGKAKANVNKARAVAQAEEEDVNEEVPPPEYDLETDQKPTDNSTRSVTIRQIILEGGLTPRIRVMVNGTIPIAACADTGTTKTIISYNIIKQNRLKIYRANERLFAANGERMLCEGKVPLKLYFQGIMTPVMALVSSSMKDEMLVSMADLKRMNILPESFPNVHSKRVSTTPVHLNEISDKLKSEYSDVFGDTLSQGPMSGKPMTIYLSPGAKPTRCLTARTIPMHWKEPANQAIRQLVESGILIRETEPTEWISPGFFVPEGDPILKDHLKKGLVIVTLKDLRLVVDYTKLNRYVKRPVHPFPATKDIISQLPPDARYFATLDAVQGYHQIALSEESSKLTTFILPSGRYRFRRAPMGLSASSDEWCYRSDQAINGLSGVLKIVDDIIVTAPTPDVLEERIRQVLERCRNHKITISRKKFQINTAVKFAGHIITAEGVKPDPDKTRALTNFKSPTTVTELRSFLGLANQLANFHPDLAHMTTKLRRLLQKGVAFQWLPEHQEDFVKIKKLLVSEAVMQYFDINRDTELLTDASRKQGLGFALMQRDPGAIDE